MLKSLCQTYFGRVHTFPARFLHLAAAAGPVPRLQPEVGRGERSEKLSAAPWSEFMCERGERCENVGTVPSL